MIRPMLTGLALAAVLALPARAQEPAPEPAPAGTVEGAASLRAALSAYLTDIPFQAGILRIAPDPSGQRVTLDPAAVLSDALGAPVRVAPLSLVVSERPDGTWNVFTRDPVAIALEAAPAGAPLPSFRYEQGAQVFKGVFSPALSAFAEGEGRISDTVSIQKDALSDTSLTISQTTLATSARPGAAGGVDLEIRQRLRGYEQTVEIRTPVLPDAGTGEGASGGDGAGAGFPISLGFGAGELDSAATVKGGCMAEVRDLYALVLRHLDALEAESEAALAGPLGTELRGALGRVLPVWTSLEAGVTARAASVVSPFVRLDVAEARQTTRLSGVAEAAAMDVDLALEGVTASGDVLPPWAAGFLPQEIAFGFAVSGLDLRTPAELAIAAWDFTADEPLSEDAGARIAATFDPSRIAVTLKPGRLRTADLDLDFEGAMSFAGAAPAATLRVSAAGLDKAIAALQSAAAELPDLHQAVGMVQMAQGFARRTPEGRWEWLVEAAADGSVAVNGTTLKGPDPAPTPAETTPPADDGATRP